MEVQKKVIDKKLYNIELPDLRSDNKDHIYKKLSENLNDKERYVFSHKLDVLKGISK